MTSVIPKPPNAERSLNVALGFNAALEFGAGSIFMFRPTLVYPGNSDHVVHQISGFLANALFCIGTLRGFAGLKFASTKLILRTYILPRSLSGHIIAY
jgi:hypothetical protein